jgi:hypothetical protein
MLSFDAMLWWSHLVTSPLRAEAQRDCLLASIRDSKDIHIQNTLGNNQAFYTTRL